MFPLPGFYIPSRGMGVRTALFLPPPGSIPQGNTRCLEIFGALGGPNSSAALQPFETREQNYYFALPFIVWAIVAVDNVAAGFRCQITQTHTASGSPDTREWFNKFQMNNNFAGSAQEPFILKTPQRIDPGDSLMCEVKNLDGTVPPAAVVASTIQICLWGVELAA